MPSHVCHSTLQPGHRTIPNAQSCMSLNLTYRSLNHSRCLVMYVTQLYNQVNQPFTLPNPVCHSTLQPGHSIIHVAQSCMSLNFTISSLNHSRCPVFCVVSLLVFFMCFGWVFFVLFFIFFYLFDGLFP